MNANKISEGYKKFTVIEVNFENFYNMFALHLKKYITENNYSFEKIGEDIYNFIHNSQSFPWITKNIQKYLNNMFK